jgi:hypothetical protein
MAIWSLIRYLVNDCWLQVDEYSPWHVLASSCLREEGVEAVVAASHRLVARHLPIRLDT